MNSLINKRDLNLGHDSQNLKVTIADDHSLVRTGLSLLIKMIDKKVMITEVSSFEQTIEVLSLPCSTDILLLDLLMPDMDGLSGAKQICQKWPEIPVVVISVKEDIYSIRRALRSGVMGYIPKSSSPNVTVGAIKLVLDGGIYVPPQVLDHEPEHTKASSFGKLDGRNEYFELGSETIKLTNRQLDIVRLLSLGESNKEIADHLGLMPGTIKMHISRIFKTFNVSNRTAVVAKYNQIANVNKLK